MLSFYFFLLGPVVLPYLVGAQCTGICQSFATGLENCKDIDSTGVDGTAPINGQGIACVCGPLNLDNLQGCYDCGQPPPLVQAWTIACVTYEQDGSEAGIACFEGLEQNINDTSNCAPPNAGQISSLSAAPVSSTAGSGGSVGSGSTTTTATPVSSTIASGGGGGSGSTTTAATPVSSTIGSGGGGGSGSTTTTAAGATQATSTSGSSSSQKANGGPLDWNMVKIGLESALALAAVVLVQAIF